jgi:CheY-like chemotaxis protein
MSNGVKFTQKGHVAIDVDYAGSDDARKLHVKVTDTGMGIAPEAMKGLFIEFNQLEASTARRFGGTGLGLAICKRLVTMMGGAIGVDSVLGVGSSFWFEVPIKPGVVAAPPPELRLPEPAARTKLNILVADDNAVNRQIVSKILFKLGHRVDLVCNGREAVAATAAGDYDLVFMDVQMPEMDGYAATRAIRSLASAARDVPIAALTANASDEDRVSCLAAGMDAFATKPVSMAKLEAVIRQLKSAGDPLVAVEAARDFVEFDATARETLRAEVGDDGLEELDQQLAVDVAGLWPEIERAAAGCERQALRRAGHTLRGAAASLGYDAIVKATDVLREACISGPDPAVANAVERLAEALRKSKLLAVRARNAA